MPAAQKFWPKQGLFSALGELGKSMSKKWLGNQPKKGRQNFRNLFEKSPLEKMLDSPQPEIQKSNVRGANR